MYLLGQKQSQVMWQNKPVHKIINTYICKINKQKNIIIMNKIKTSICEENMSLILYFLQHLLLILLEGKTAFCQTIKTKEHKSHKYANFCLTACLSYANMLDLEDIALYF